MPGYAGTLREYGVHVLGIFAAANAGAYAVRKALQPLAVLAPDPLPSFGGKDA